MIDRQTDVAVAELPVPELPEPARGDGLGWVPWLVALAFVGFSLLLLGFGSKLRKENNDLAQRLAETEYAYSDLQSQQASLQHKLTRVETNYATRVADLQKQLVQKNQEQERQKVELETRAGDATQARKQVNMLQNQLASNTAELDRLSQQLSGVNSPNQDSFSQTRLGLLIPTPDGPASASASALYDLHEQRGMLVTENLSPLPPDREYQLWLLDPNINGPVSGGTFRVNERGGVRTEYKAVTQLKSPDRFAISIERKGGSTVPQGRFVLTSN
ncbi:MAG TPA: anti-sigma factor [Verrucomicrobiae bacterium]|nr:anti-sigma factor [Verrucomicrobiae bacterium]